MPQTQHNTFTQIPENVSFETIFMSRCALFYQTLNEIAQFQKSCYSF